jgi:hypothetical protein
MNKTWIKAAAVMLLGAACAAAQAGVIAGDATYGWFDGGSGTRILRIDEHGSVGKVVLSIDFAKCNDPGVGADGRCIDNTRSFDNEIFFRLSSPTGTTVRLVAPWTYAGTSVGTGRVTVSFDDLAGWAVGSAQFNHGNVTAGSFRPLEALELLQGRDMFGDWTLTVGDAGFGDPLEYFGARLEVAMVAEPGMAAVMGMGLLMMGASLRLGRRRYEKRAPRRPFRMRCRFAQAFASATRLAMCASASSTWSIRIRDRSPGCRRARALSMATNSPLISST